MLKTSFCKNERIDRFGEESRALTLPHSSVRKQWAQQNLVHSLVGGQDSQPVQPTAKHWKKQLPLSHRKRWNVTLHLTGIVLSVFMPQSEQACFGLRLEYFSLTCIKGSFQPVALSQCKRIVCFSSALINCTHSWHKQSIKCKLFVITLRFILQLSWVHSWAIEVTIA